MPASNQPVETSLTWSALLRSTGGPQAADATNMQASSGQHQARMPAILEHLKFDPLERLLARQLARQERAQIRTAQPHDNRLLVRVGGRQPRPLFVAARRDCEPLVGSDAEGCA